MKPSKFYLLKTKHIAHWVVHQRLWLASRFHSSPLSPIGLLKYTEDATTKQRKKHSCECFQSRWYEYLIPFIKPAMLFAIIKMSVSTVRYNVKPINIFPTISYQGIRKHICSFCLIHARSDFLLLKWIIKAECYKNRMCRSRVFAIDGVRLCNHKDFRYGIKFQ